MKFYAPIPRVVGGDDHHDLLRRLFRPNATPGTQRIDLITTTLRVAAIDSGNNPNFIESEGDTTVHVLWQMDEMGATITVGGDTWPVAPGDTTAIPTGDEWLLSPNQLAVLIVRRANDIVLPIAPHHGEERFTGHNRETIYAIPHVSRWKLTEPFTLPACDHDVAIIGLYNDLALQHETEVAMLAQGDVRVIRPGDGAVTLVPNGLTYALIIRT